MFKPLPLLVLAGLLAACAGSPSAPSDAPAAEAPGRGCAQADWQAETAPVINKRSGPEGLDKYETQPKTQEHGCP